MEKLKGKKPSIRFPEFKDDWEFKNGGDVFETVSNKNHNSDLPILAISQEFGAVPREMINYQISVTEKSVASYKVVDVGDYIISLRSFQGGIEYSNYKGICSPAYIILRPFIEIDRDFFRYYFKTYKYIQGLNSKLEGIRDGKMISYKYFSEIPLPFPSIPEQKRIAAFFTVVNKKIAELKQKKALLEQYKKGVMQKLFSQELRFKDENGKEFPKWDKKKLGEMCRMQAGKFINATEIYNEINSELFPCYGGNGLRGYTKTFNQDGKYPLIGRQGAHCGNVTLAQGKFYATEHAVVVYSKTGFNVDWMIYLLNTLNLNQYSTGLAQPGLSVQNIEKVKALVPVSIVEQSKIANFLSAIDEKINRTENQIQQTQEWKKGLLQNMNC